MSILENKSLVHLAPGPGRVFEQKIEEALPSNPSIDLGGSKSKPRIEDFVFFAAAQRAAEREQDGIIKHKIADKCQLFASYPKLTGIRHSPITAIDLQTEGLTDDEVEKINAWRALRQASWAGAFYLCTTDILGPFNTPYAFRQNGYVPGTLLYVFMGAAAFYCGALLWWLYVKLDSDRFPVKSYSDIAERVVGKPLRIFVTWLVFIHIIVNIATTSLGSAQSLVQVTQATSNGSLCFVVAIIIWIIVGIVLNQIRTLKRYSWLSSTAIWLNLLVIFLSIGFVAHSPPNYAAAKAAYGIPKGQVSRPAFASYPFFERINGVMNIVYAYGGATIFAQIIAEMRRPMDFLKAFSMAQGLIFTVYVFYGLFVYSFQGQFTLPVAFQGVSHPSWHTVGNVLSLISGIIAGGLYGNIGLKILYVNVVEDFFHGPIVVIERGRFAWTALVVAFWVVGFVIGAAIPQIQTLSGMVGAVANMQFTYSFPSGFTFLYLMQLDAIAGDNSYTPGSLDKIDTWLKWSRWKRGLFGGSWSMLLFKWFNFLLSIAALATAGLGIYGSGLSIRNAFKTAAATSFGCAAPL